MFRTDNQVVGGSGMHSVNDRQQEPDRTTGSDPYSGLPCMTGDTSTDWALWNLSLLLRQVAESNADGENKPPPSLDDGD